MRQYIVIIPAIALIAAVEVGWRPYQNTKVPRTQSESLTATLNHNDGIGSFATREHLVYVSQKVDCDQFYPLPNGYENWSNCKQAGGTACGGPDQCACDSTQRLITFKCDQGTYHQCYGETGNGCQ